MANEQNSYPLLVFPTRSEVGKQSLGGGGNRITSPSARRQGERIGPKLEALRRTFESRSLELSITADTVDPEEVLVLEAACNVDKLIEAVEKVDGLEWLGEALSGLYESDDDFYLEDKHGNRKDLTGGMLYLISSNHRALQQILSLWDRYQSGKRAPNGYSGFFEVFKKLRNLRKWSVQDRLSESTLEKLNELAQAFPNQCVKMEIELWHRRDMALRNQKIQEFREIVDEFSGEILDGCDIPQIEYTAFLVSLPYEVIQDVLAHVDCKLFNFDGVRYARPQSIVNFDIIDAEDEDIQQADVQAEELPTGEPIVGVFDGLPLQRHEILRDRMIVDDPDGYDDAGYLVEYRKHGTAICSCVIKGDLADNLPSIDTPLYVRPILYPDHNNPKHKEALRDRLPVDLIHRAILRMYRGDGGQAPTAPSVRIINLSFGIDDYLCNGVISPLARLLDYLSVEYRVIFIVSAGNSDVELTTQYTADELKNMTSDEREAYFFKMLVDDIKNRPIMSPAESMNNITVGALHEDATGFVPTHIQYLSAYENILPSVYTTYGPGINGTIKPDLVEKGGRNIYKDYLYNGRLWSNDNTITPGIVVAYPDTTTRKQIHDRGTSEAAALTARNAYFCYKALKEMSQYYPALLDYTPEFIKAMVVHGCEWGDIGERIDLILAGRPDDEIKTAKRLMLGYGKPNILKSTICSDHYATILGYGKLAEDEAHLYRIPLPGCLSTSTAKRKITITLAWLTLFSALFSR